MIHQEMELGEAEVLISLILMPICLRISCLSQGQEMASQVADNMLPIRETPTTTRL